MAEKIVLAELDINIKSLDKSTTLAKKRVDELKKSLKSLESQTKKNTKEFFKLNSEFLKINKSYYKSLEVLSKLSEKQENRRDISQENLNAIKELNKENKLLNRERDSANSKLAKLIEREKRRKDSLKVVEGSIKALRKENSRLRKERNDVNITTEDGRRKIQQLNIQIDKNNELIKQSSDSLTKQKINIGNYASAWNAASGILNKATSVIGVSIGVIQGLRLVLRDSTNRILEFNKSVTKFRSLLNISTKEAKLLTVAVNEIASSSVKTSTEVADLVGVLASLGKTQSEILNLLKPVNDLSIALETTSESAGELLVTTLNAFQESSSEAERYANVIAKVRSSTALDFERINDAFGFLTSTAKAAGVSIEQTGAIVGVLVDNNIKASRAGRLTSSSLLRLADAGLTLNDALDKINETQAKTSDEIVLLSEASQLFGKESAALGLILANNRDKLDSLTKSFENSEKALQSLVDIQTESLTAKIALLESAWEGFILTIEDGEGVIGSFVKSTLEGITSLINELTSVARSSDIIALQASIESQKIASKDLEDQAKKTGKTRREIALNLIDQNESFLNSEKEKLNALIEQRNSLAKADEEAFGANAGLVDGIRDLLNTIPDNSIVGDLIGDITTLSDLDDLIDETSKSVGILQGRYNALSEEIKQVDNNQKDLNKTSNDLNDSLISSINIFSESLRNVSVDTSQSIKDIFNSLNDEFEKSIDESEKNRLSALEERFLGEINLLRENGSNYLDIELEQERNRTALILEQENLTTEQRKAIQLDFIDFERNINQQRLNNSLKTFESISSIFNSLGGLYEQNSQQQKLLASFEALINTSTAITKTLSAFAGVPIPGYAIAQSVAIGLQGLTQINRINNTKVPKFEKGGFIKLNGKSHAQGGEDVVIGGKTVANVQGGEAIGVLKRSATEAFMDFNNSFPNDKGQSFKSLGSMQTGGVILPTNTNTSLNANQIERIMQFSVDSIASKLIVAVPVNEVNDVNADIQATITDGNI